MSDSNVTNPQNDTLEQYPMILGVECVQIPKNVFDKLVENCNDIESVWALLGD